MNRYLPKSNIIINEKTGERIWLSYDVTGIYLVVKLESGNVLKHYVVIDISTLSDTLNADGTGIRDLLNLIDTLLIPILNESTISNTINIEIAMSDSNVIPIDNIISVTIKSSYIGDSVIKFNIGYNNIK